jgi:hypothetical protein
MYTRILLACILFSFSVRGQEPKNNVLAGFKFGMIINMLGPASTDSMGTKYTFHPKCNIILGVRSEISIGRSITFLPEVTIHDKGSKVAYTPQTYFGAREVYGSISDWCVEFAANLLGIISRKKGTFEIGGGPATSIDLGSYSQTKAGDFGVNFLTRFKFVSGFSAELNFNKGLKSRVPDLSGLPYGYYDKESVRTSSIGLCLGYTF